jgi:LAO/AO transport system kinase
MGDEIQAIKAGIMEIADIFVVNKADRDGAAKLQRELMTMIEMSPIPPGGWKPPVVTIRNSFKPEEFEEDLRTLSVKVLEHYDFLVTSNLIGDRQRRKRLHELNEALRSSILEPVLGMLVKTGELDLMVDKIVKKESDPSTLAEEVAKKYLQGCF